MKSLLKYLKNYKKESVFAPLFKMLEASFELFVPLVVAKIIDNGIAKGDNIYVLKMGGALLLLAIIGLTCSLTAQYFAAKAAAGFGTEVRHALFKHIQTFSYDEIDRLGSSTLITRLTSDLNQVQSQVNMFLRLFLRSPFIVFGATIMAFTVDVKAALVFVVAIPILAVIVFGIMLATIPMYKKVQNGLDKILSATRENLSGTRVVRAFNKEQNEIDSYNESNDALNKFQIFVGKISAVMNPLTFVVVNFAMIGIIYVGGIRVAAGYLTQGMVVALINYMSQILIELIKLANLIINLTKAFACANRIEDVMKVESSMKFGNETEGKNKEIAVEFKDVSLMYAGSSENTIEGLNLKVLKGQTIGVIGGTGSGKTSLINMIPRFYDATKGEVLVNGTNVKEYTEEGLRNKIGIVPQKAVLFKGTIRSNLLWGNESATENDLMEALKQAQSYDFVMQKENGIDSVVEQNGRNFSGGQRQRLTIARALVRKPEILILDDSSSALDYTTDANLRKEIAKLKDMTVFIVSQRTASIMDADQIVVLDDGNIMGIGTHKELLENCEVYKEIYESQFKKPEKEEM